MKERRHDDLSPEDEALVERLVQGGIDPAEAETDPRLRRILALQRQLDEVGAAEAIGASAGGEAGPSVLVGEAGASALVGEAGPSALVGEAERRVEDLVRRTLGPRDPVVPAARFRLLAGPGSVLVGLAALALIALSLWAVFGREGADPRTVGDGNRFELGREGDVEISLREAADGAIEIAWNATPRLGSEYRVQVFSADPTAGGVLLASSIGLDQAVWRPADDHEAGETEVSAWPETVWMKIDEVRSTMSAVDTLVEGAVAR